MVGLVCGSVGRVFTQHVQSPGFNPRHHTHGVWQHISELSGDGAGGSGVRVILYCTVSLSTWDIRDPVKKYK